MRPSPNAASDTHTPRPNSEFTVAHFSVRNIDALIAELHTRADKTTRHLHKVYFADALANSKCGWLRLQISADDDLSCECSLKVPCELDCRRSPEDKYGAGYTDARRFHMYTDRTAIEQRMRVLLGKKRLTLDQLKSFAACDVQRLCVRAGDDYELWVEVTRKVDVSWPVGSSDGNDGGEHISFMEDSETLKRRWKDQGLPQFSYICGNLCFVSVGCRYPCGALSTMKDVAAKFELRSLDAADCEMVWMPRSIIEQIELAEFQAGQLGMYYAAGEHTRALNPLDSGCRLILWPGYCCNVFEWLRAWALEFVGVNGTGDSTHAAPATSMGTCDAAASGTQVRALPQAEGADSEHCEGKAEDEARRLVTLLVESLLDGLGLVCERAGVDFPTLAQNGDLMAEDIYTLCELDMECFVLGPHGSDELLVGSALYYALHLWRAPRRLTRAEFAEVIQLGLDVNAAAVAGTAADAQVAVAGEIGETISSTVRVHQEQQEEYVQQSPQQSHQQQLQDVSPLNSEENVCVNSKSVIPTSGVSHISDSPSLTRLFEQALQRLTPAELHLALACYDVIRRTGAGGVILYGIDLPKSEALTMCGLRRNLFDRVDVGFRSMFPQFDSKSTLQYSQLVLPYLFLI